MATAQAMSVEDVASWAAGLFDDAVVRKLTEGYIDGEMLALYAKQDHHELLKRDLDLPPGLAGKLWRSIRALVGGGAEEGTPPRSATSAQSTPRTTPRSSAASISSASVSERSDSAHRELQSIKVKALKRRALAAGATSEELDEAEDADNHKRAIIELIIQKEAAASSDVGRKLELAGMKVRALKKLAAAAGVSEEQLEDAEDEDDHKGAIIVLILEHEAKKSGGGGEAAKEALRAELQGLRMKALKQRAIAAGVSEERVDDAADEDDYKAAVIALVVEAELSSSGSPREVPHFGDGKARKPSVEGPAAAPLEVAAGKHAMLSYQWDNQDEVVRVRDLLQQRGIPTWMDIDGGMEVDIYDSMASGVQNAFCVIAFTSQKYQDSHNCQLELKFAKQHQIPIVSVKVEGHGWKPSGWLGIVTAGALWIPLYKEDKFDSSVDSIVSQISQHAAASDGAVQLDSGSPNRGSSSETAEDAEAAAARARSELEKLRTEVDVDANVTSREEAETGLAFVPAQVPHLTDAFRWTPDMQRLKERLLADDGGSGESSTLAVSSVKARVGAFGMGGIGKTVMASFVARDDDIRQHFDLIVWITLSQTPDIPKCQQLMHLQLTGTEMPADKSGEEAREILTQAMRGKKALLILDDVWDDETEEVFSCCADRTTGSRTLVTTRIRGLLQSAEQIEVGLPSEEDAIELLLKSAGLVNANPIPPEAAEIVRICGRLPLAVDIAGKLLNDLVDDVTDAWTGIPSMLRAEMSSGDGEETALEYRVISASLKSIPGRDQEAIRQVFSVFALVPEDTHVPPQVFRMLLSAVTGKKELVSDLQLRKWLQTLINRSLVLGTWERPQLHDITREYTMSKLSDEETVQLQRRVIDVFFDLRPVSLDPELCGLGAWQKQPGNAAARYVEFDGEHHVEAALEGLDLGRELPDYLSRWMGKYPGCVVDAKIDGCSLARHVVTAVGGDRMRQVVDHAEEKQDWWLFVTAAQGWSWTRVLKEGISAEVMDWFEKTAIVLWFRSLKHLFQKPVHVTELEYDHCRFVSRLTVLMFQKMVDGTGIHQAAVDRVREEIVQMVPTSQVAKMRPAMRDDAVYQCEISPIYQRADLAAADPKAVALWQEAWRRTYLEEERSICARFRPLLMACGAPGGLDMDTVGAFGIGICCPNWDWSVYGENCENLIEVLDAYCAVMGEQSLEDWCSYPDDDLWSHMTRYGLDAVLYSGALAGHAGMLAYRGHITAAHRVLDATVSFVVDLIMPMVEQRESAGNGQGMATMQSNLQALFWAPATGHLFPMLGRLEDSRRMLAARGWSWEGADDLVDAADVPDSFLRPRGKEDPPGKASMMNAEMLSWGAKLICALSDCPVPEAQALATLPSVEEAQKMMLSSRKVHMLPRYYFCSLGLNVALVYEKFGRTQTALEHVDAILRWDRADPDTDHRPNVHAEAHTLRGRLLAADGDFDASEVAFEEAVYVADQHGLRLLVLLALRDLTQCIHLASSSDGRRVGEGMERIGAALRQMHATTAELTDLLNLRGGSFDAAEILSSTPPDASIKAAAPKKGRSDGAKKRAKPTAAASKPKPSGKGLRAELQPLRVMALHKRATAEGCDASDVDDAMDSDDPKVALIELLVKCSSVGGAVGSDAQLRAELQGMRVMALHKRALSDGADETAVDGAMDSDDPKAELVTLILAQHAGADPQAAEAAAKAKALETLRAELQPLRVMELYKRAVSTGVDAAQAEDAMDVDDPKAELIALLLDAA